MGASDSKLVFKQGIFRLSEQAVIAADDEYWTGFWELPESAEDVFTLFSPTDIRRTRDNALPNLETLILAVVSRLCVLRSHPSFPDPDLAPERDALNCIRVLTRILPFIYESDALEEWDEKFFWGARKKRTRKSKVKSEVLFDGAAPQSPQPEEAEFEDAKPLAEELIDTLVDLLFFSDFTLQRVVSGKPKVSYAIWQSGVGCHTPVTSTREFENNRTEVLRLLLVLCSKAMYMSPALLPAKGVRAITYLTTRPDKQVVLSLLCSLLNTTLKYNPATWRVPYDHVVFKDNKQLLVNYCLQFLLVLVLYPIPETQHGVTPKNVFRHFLGRLHRPQDFQFIVDGMNRILNQPLQANTSYIPGMQKITAWAPEMLMLFWETLQCNKRFRSFIIDTERAHDFIVLVIFYAMDSRHDPTKQGLIRMCVFVLQTMSVEPNFGKSLNKRFEGQETLPQSIRIPNFHGSYADYLITSIHTLLTSGKGNLEAVYPALLAIINNIAPYVENIGRATTSKLLQLFNSMSSPSYLFANETNHSLLRSLLEAINAIIEHQYNKNPNLLYAIVRHRNKFENLHEFTLESAQEEIERINQQRKDQNSSTSTRGSRSGSLDTARSPTIRQGTGLSNVPEENDDFVIGDEDDSEVDHGSPKPAQRSGTQSVGSSRAPSISSLPDDVPLQLRGMSEKARGKMPVGAPSFSRTNSMSSLHSLSNSVSHGAYFQPTAEWIESWQPELPLHTILSTIQDLSSQLPHIATSRSSSISPPSSDTAQILSVLRAASLPNLDISPIKVHLFEWSPLALGWYESLLWGFVFQAEMGVSKGTAGVWNSTSVKLFRVQEAPGHAPSLLSPRGAVDAVGSNLVNRIGSLNLRAGLGGRAASSDNVTVRDV